MPVIYIKVRAIFQPNGSHIDFLLLRISHWICYDYVTTTTRLAVSVMLGPVGDNNINI